MEFHQLRSFVAVAEEGSLTKAAEKIFSSQPAISAHIKALEEEFGLPLFERTARGMVLTEAGRQLFEQGSDILDAKHRLANTAASLRQQKAGLLRLGLVNEPESLQLDALLKGTLARCPGLRFEFQHGRSGAIAKALVSRELDAGFFEGDQDREHIEHVLLGRIRLCIVGPMAWAAELASEDFHVLEQKPWSYVSPDCGYYRVLRELAQKHDLQLDYRFQNDEEQNALHFARTGLALSLVREQQAAPLAERGELFVWPHFRHDNPLYFGTLLERRNEPALQALREALGERGA